MREIIRANSDRKFPNIMLGKDKWYGSVALGNGTQFNFLLTWIEYHLHVSIDEHGAYRFKGFVHRSYAQEKLKLLSGDARNVADFINAQLGCDDITQGRYDEDLLEGCSDGSRD